MTNPTTRNDEHDVPIDVYDEPDAVTVGTGSYGLGHGVTMTVNFEYVGELVDDDIERDVEALLQVALERALERMDNE
jgi:hypothetical protein